MFNPYITKPVCRLYVTHIESSLLCRVSGDTIKGHSGKRSTAVRVSQNLRTVFRILSRKCDLAGEPEPSHGLSHNFKEVRFGTTYGICRETVCAKASDAIASSWNDEVNSAPCKICAAPTEQRCFKVNTGFRDERGMDGETSSVRFMHKFDWLQYVTLN